MAVSNLGNVFRQVARLNKSTRFAEGDVEQATLSIPSGQGAMFGKIRIRGKCGIGQAVPADMKGACGPPSRRRNFPSS